MRFVKIDEESIRADNLSNTGAVYYLRWHDENQNQYVQITKVVGGSGAGNGTYSSELYRLEEIGVNSNFSGYDPVSGSATKNRNNNMSGFLRAAKQDILAKKMKEPK